jgi:hypothetical protein
MNIEEYYRVYPAEKYNEENPQEASPPIGNINTVSSLVYNGNKSTKLRRRETRWVNDVVYKQQDIVDGGITRDSIVQEMRRRNLNYKMVLAFESCSTHSRRKFCADCGYEEFLQYSCDNRLCPVCASRREKRIKSRYRRRIKAMQNPKLLTVTVGHVEGVDGNVVSEHKKLFYKLVRKLEKKIKSGFVITEFSSTFHLHFHAVIDTPNYISMDKLQGMWYKITGGESWYVHIKRTNPGNAMNYVIKYLVKCPEFDSSSKFVDYYQLTHKRRLLSTFGLMYAKNLSVLRFSKPCPHCGGKIIVSHSFVLIRHAFLLDVLDDLAGGVSL